MSRLFNFLILLGVFLASTASLSAQATFCERYAALTISQPLASVQSAQQEFQKILDHHRAAGVKEDHLPYILSHGEKTKGVIVLAHGIGESPQAMRQIADSYYKAGFNVVTVLLEGHGSDPRYLAKLALDPTSAVHTWEKQIQDSIQIAHGLGTKVIVGGYSTGGAMAVTGLNKNIRVDGVALYAPALGFHPIVTRIQERIGKKAAQWENENNPSFDPKAVPPKFSDQNPNQWLKGTDGPEFDERGYRSPPATLYYLTEEAMIRAQKYLQSNSLATPTNIVYSTTDILVDPQALQAIAAKSAKVDLQAFPDGSKTDHKSVIQGDGAQNEINKQIEWAKQLVQ